MNRYEFYDHLLNYKNNSLAHSDINKYYRKVDLGNGKWRYFYSKEEYDAYENNKKLQGTSKDNAEGAGKKYQNWVNSQNSKNLSKASSDNAKGAGSDYQRYLDEQKAKKAEEERLEKERRAEISRRNDQGRYEAIQKATGGIAPSSITSTMDLGNVKDYVSGDVKSKVADVINSISSGSNIDINSISNVLGDLKKDLNNAKSKATSGVDIDNITKTLSNINELNELIKDYNKNGITDSNYSRATDILKEANIISGNKTKKESNPTTSGNRVVDWVAGTVMPWLFGLFS